MPTVSYTVAASADDTNHTSISNDSGASVTTGSVIAGNISNTLLSPGSHNSGDEWSVGCRFTGVAVPNGATITSATFSMKAQAAYNAGANTISLLVALQDADNPGNFTTGATTNLRTTNRPRTTASTTWNATSVTGGTRYNVDVTSQVQAVVNRAGWASGNAMVVIVDTATATTLGEWQDFYAWDDATDRTNNPPQLSITYTTGGGAQTIGMNAISAGTTLYNPAATPGAVTAATNAIAAATTLNQPTVTQGGVVVQHDTIAAATALYQPAVTTGAVTVATDAISAGTTLYQPSVAQGPVTVATNAISSATALYQPSVGTALTDWELRLAQDGYTDVNGKQIVRTSGDRVYMIVAECDNYPYETGDRMIVYRADQTGIPTSFTQSIQTAITNPAVIAIGLDASDDIHVVWHDRSSGDLYYRVWDTGTDGWAAAAETIETGLETGTGQGDTRASMALDGDGVPHVVYCKSDGTRQRVSYRNRVGGTWSSATQLDAGVTYGSNERAWVPNIIFDMLGNRVVAWHRGTFNATSGGTCYTNVYSGGAWGGAVSVGSSWIEIDNGTSMLATVHGSNGNRIHLTFVDGTTNGDEEIRYYRSDDAGATWTADHPGGGTQQSHNPALGPGDGLGAIRIYGHGTPAGTDHGDDLYYFESTDGGDTWGSWTLLVTGTDLDSSVNTRWSRYHWHFPSTLDIAYWDNDYPNLLIYGGSRAALDITTSAIASGTALYQPAAAAGGSTVATNAIAAGTALYQPSAAPGAVTVAADALGSGTTLPQPAVAPGAVTVAADTIASGTALQQPSVTVGSVTVATDALGATTTLYALTVVPSGTLAPETIAAGTTLYQPAVAPGSVSVAMQTIASALTLHQPTVTTGTTIALDTVASTLTIHQPAVTPGAVTVATSAIAATLALYAPRVSGGTEVTQHTLAIGDAATLTVTVSDAATLSVAIGDAATLTLEITGG